MKSENFIYLRSAVTGLMLAVSLAASADEMLSLDVNFSYAEKSPENEAKMQADGSLANLRVEICVNVSIFGLTGKSFRCPRVF